MKAVAAQYCYVFVFPASGIPEAIEFSFCTERKISSTTLRNHYCSTILLLYQPPLMSGHSKWANIRVRKTAQDKARGKIYTRHARLIEMAARGGDDPATNNTLRVAVESARADNVPNANIERAIKKGSGALGGEQMAEVVYAAYLPVRGGVSVACLIECLTDNRNRTNANLKGIVGKSGGSMAETNAVLWMFTRAGLVVAKAAEHMTPAAIEELELELIDFGAQDVEAAGETVSVTTGATEWPQIRDFLKQRNFVIQAAGLKYLPTQKAKVTEPEAVEKLIAFVDAIEEDDDVSEVHTNAEL
jgi:YebC/PmpR family DNA-binding regulatory protein